MIISNNTLQILKNYSQLNSNFLFKKGNYIATKTDNGIVSYAKVDEYFERDFGIYNLSEFLSILNIDKDESDIEFDADAILIKGLNGRSCIRYTTTMPSLLLIPENQDEQIKKSGGKIKKQTDTNYLIPNYEHLLPKFTPTVSFNLTQEDFERISKVSKILGNTHIAIENDTKQVKLNAYKSSTSTSHTNSINLDIPVISNEYKLVFSVEKLNIVSSNYFVEISERGMSKFTNLDRELIYFISLNTSESYFK